MSANSIPTAPAPTTTSEPGALSWKSAPVDDQIRSSSICRKGRLRGRDPVAMMMSPAVIRRFSPSLSTSTAPPPSSRPYPSMWATLFFFRRNLTPFERRFATVRLRSCAGPRSTLNPSNEIP